MIFLKPRNYQYLLAVAALLLISSNVRADDAYSWLRKIQNAAWQQNYVGTFIYRHGQQMEVMRIAHRVRKGQMHERIVSLNGSAREVIRDNRFEHTYLPDKKLIIISSRDKHDSEFPVLLPHSLKDLSKYYQVMLAAQGRIADRRVQMVAIKPKDKYRYGYRLWADQKTGLLLKADLVTMQGKILEQYMFTNIRIGGPIPMGLLRPGIPRKGMRIEQQTGKLPTQTLQQSWKVARLPKGFRLLNTMNIFCKMHDAPVQHQVYTDGLAAVSVFIEKINKHSRRQQTIMGLNSMGAIHAYGRVIKGHQVTVVGHVPADTVRKIAQTIARQ